MAGTWVERLNHFGIVAGMCREIGLAPVSRHDVDQRLPLLASRRRVR